MNFYSAYEKEPSDGDDFDYSGKTAPVMVMPEMTIEGHLPTVQTADPMRFPEMDIYGRVPKSPLAVFKKPDGSFNWPIVVGASLIGVAGLAFIASTLVPKKRRSRRSRA